MSHHEINELFADERQFEQANEAPHEEIPMHTTSFNYAPIPYDGNIQIRHNGQPFTLENIGYNRMHALKSLSEYTLSVTETALDRLKRFSNAKQQ